MKHISTKYYDEEYQQPFEVDSDGRISILDEGLEQEIAKFEFEDIEACQVREMGQFLLRVADMAERKEVEGSSQCNACFDGKHCEGEEKYCKCDCINEEKKLEVKHQ